MRNLGRSAPVWCNGAITRDANWRKPLKWNREAEAAGIRLKVFCASLADWLDNQAPQEWRNRLATIVETTPNLDWLLLTKRPQNWPTYSPWISPPKNVWLGMTAENQEEFDRRWRHFENIDAGILFISYEPALGPLSLRNCSVLPDWVICGGESGSSAREMDPAWARSIRDECADLGLFFFMKQMTHKATIPDDLMVREFPVDN